MPRTSRTRPVHLATEPPARCHKPDIGRAPTKCSSRSLAVFLPHDHITSKRSTNPRRGCRKTHIQGIARRKHPVLLEFSLSPPEFRHDRTSPRAPEDWQEAAGNCATQRKGDSSTWPWGFSSCAPRPAAASKRQPRAPAVRYRMEKACAEGPNWEEEPYPGAADCRIRHRADLSTLFFGSVLTAPAPSIRLRSRSSRRR